jgi:hypothetical protein
VTRDRARDGDGTLRWSRGAVFLEHLTVLSLCGLVTAALLLAIGAFKVRVYSAQREALYQPYP